MRNGIKKTGLVLLLLTSGLLLTGCNASVGVGMSVGVPIGNHSYMSIGTGTGRWY